MNDKQITLLWIVAAAIFTMLICPPYVMYGRGVNSQAIIDSGYAFIFQLPDSARIDVGALLTQWVGVLLSAGCVFFALSKKDK